MNGQPGEPATPSQSALPADPRRPEPANFEVAPAVKPDAGQSTELSVDGGSSWWTRRAAAVGGLAAVAGVGALGLNFLRQRRPHSPDPRALKLYRRGQTLERNGPSEAQGQVIDLYQAVAVDAEYAEAWGALALSYRQPRMTPLTTWSDPDWSARPRSAHSRSIRTTLMPNSR